LIVIAARVRIIVCPEKKDLSEWVAAGGTREQLDTLIEAAPDARTPDGGAAPTPCTIEETLKVFDKWLLLKDQTPVITILGAVAANLLPGDPV
jgi:hypothetical protein